MAEYSLSPKEASALSCSEIPNSSDSISREDAIDDLHTQLMYRMGSDDMKRRLDDWVKTLPSADVVQVVHGKWIDEDPAFAEYFANCSVCGYEIDVHYERGYFNFCPNCGADMRGEQDG